MSDKIVSTNSFYLHTMESGCCYKYEERSWWFGLGKLVTYLICMLPRTRIDCQLQEKLQS